MNNDNGTHQRMEPSAAAAVGDVVVDTRRGRVVQVTAADGEVLTVTRPAGLSWETRRQNCRQALPGERREFEIASRTPEESRSDDEPLPQEIEWRLPRHARSVGRARTLLWEQASSWELPRETTETATLLLSELMTNAYRHAKVSPGREIWTRCVLTAGLLHIAVSDANTTPPAPRQACTEDESGRGLTLVATLSDRWGTELRPGGIGKTVWFELTVARGAWP
ncbi:ATP-binding protein [Streptomyces flavofungini]|uniref:ATP-binding protein n=1 Tax=Streptomyces flavofungini TaxID=68200 RepID=UPI0025B2586A|nr:ATP-binding protein [Streptomyces flavofungini]WJV48186.1 ATP-binding protein [Streptomyces flavofungini]